MDAFMMDSQLLLDWLKSDDSAIQLEALEQLCTMILFCDNVDRLFEQLSPRLFIPALAQLFVKYKKVDDEKLKAKQFQEQKSQDSLITSADTQNENDNPTDSSAASATPDTESEEAKNAKIIAEMLKSDSEAEKNRQKFSVLESSARALTNFFDASVTGCSKRLIQVNGALSAMSFYISDADLNDRFQKDLAEQLVKAFEFISSREPDELYKAGALRGILKLIKKGRNTDNGKSKLFPDTVTSAMNIVNRLVTKFRPNENSSGAADGSDNENEDIVLLADLALHNPSKTTSFACLKCVNSILFQLARNGKDLPKQLCDVKNSKLAEELLLFVICQMTNSINDDENENNDSFNLSELKHKSPSKNTSHISNAEQSSFMSDTNNASTAGTGGNNQANQLSCTIIATLVNLTFILLTQCPEPASNLEIAIKKLDLNLAFESILLYRASKYKCREIF